jgi:hypothetical protein
VLAEILPAVFGGRPTWLRRVCDDQLVAPDAGQPSEDAHDVLAAEAFAMPARDPDLNAGPVLLPEDPSGSSEPPHDVLAAEEFPMPAPRVGSDVAGGLGARVGGARTVALAAVALGAVVLLLRFIRRH